MKRTLINKIGKVGKRNLNANKELKIKYQELGITRCEKCNTEMFLTFAHKHKREWYRKQERQHLLADMNETLLLCQKHHDEIEVSKEKTEKLFSELRPID